MFDVLETNSIYKTKNLQVETFRNKKKLPNAILLKVEKCQDETYQILETEDVKIKNLNKHKQVHSLT